MGFMTIISILNDGWDAIKSKPEEFIKNIERGMLFGGSSVRSFGVGYHANPMMVKSSKHADFTQLVMACENRMTDLLECPRSVYNQRGVQALGDLYDQLVETELLIEAQKKEIKRTIADICVGDIKANHPEAIEQIKNNPRSRGRKIFLESLSAENKKLFDADGFNEDEIISLAQKCEML